LSQHITTTTFLPHHTQPVPTTEWVLPVATATHHPTAWLHTTLSRWIHTCGHDHTAWEATFGSPFHTPVHATWLHSEGSYHGSHAWLVSRYSTTPLFLHHTHHTIPFGHTHHHMHTHTYHLCDTTMTTPHATHSHYTTTHWPTISTPPTVTFFGPPPFHHTLPPAFPCCPTHALHLPLPFHTGPFTYTLHFTTASHHTFGSTTCPPSHMGWPPPQDYCDDTTCGHFLLPHTTLCHWFTICARSPFRAPATYRHHRLPHISATPVLILSRIFCLFLMPDWSLLTLFTAPTGYHTVRRCVHFYIPSTVGLRGLCSPGCLLPAHRTTCTCSAAYTAAAATIPHFLRLPAATTSL